MIKNILSITLFSAAMLFVSPQQMSASASIEFIDVNSSSIVIKSGSNYVHVLGANAKTLCVYDLSGKCVKMVKIDSADFRFDLSSLNKGIYLVKVGDVTRKLLIS